MGFGRNMTGMISQALNQRLAQMSGDKFYPAARQMTQPGGLFSKYYNLQSITSNPFFQMMLMKSQAKRQSQIQNLIKMMNPQPAEPTQPQPVQDTGTPLPGELPPNDPWYQYG